MVFLDPIATAIRWRFLIGQMTRRQIEGRYRGSLLGLLWALFHPLLYLAAFTFVFGVVFGARWGVDDDGRGGFALTLFAGLIVYWMVNETLSGAPTLVTGSATLVKRVLFPVEILPIVGLLAALFHAAVAALVWVVGHVFLFGAPPATALAAPVVILPLVLAALGGAWVIAGVAVYVRDLGQVVAVGLTLLLFLSPIFYPLEAVPEAYRWMMRLNPLAYGVEWARGALLRGTLPDPLDWLIATAAGWLVAVAGLALFRRLRRGFADVL